MEYICDICGMKMEKTSGYAYTTTQVATSLGYWNKVLREERNSYGVDGSALGMAVTIMVAHSTPWIVCGSCASIVSADKEQARRYCASEKDPPGCGPADRIEAMMTAAYAWSLIFNEWPVSMQVGSRPITHDPKAGTRCDFCRRIMYGDEKFGVFHQEMYEKMVADSARFIRTPTPELADKDGKPLWVACFNCLERSKSHAASNQVIAQDKKWWQFWKP